MQRDCQIYNPGFKSLGLHPEGLVCVGGLQGAERAREGGVITGSFDLLRD